MYSNWSLISIIRQKRPWVRDIRPIILVSRQRQTYQHCCRTGRTTSAVCRFTLALSLITCTIIHEQIYVISGITQDIDTHSGEYRSYHSFIPVLFYLFINCSSAFVVVILSRKYYVWRKYWDRKKFSVEFSAEISVLRSCELKSYLKNDVSMFVVVWTQDNY